MKRIEELDDEQAAFTLYRVAESALSKASFHPDETVEPELRAAFGSVLGDNRAKQLLERIRDDDRAAGEAARTVLAAIRDRTLLDGHAEQLDVLLAKPPSSETLDFGLGIGGIALVGLLLSLRSSYTDTHTITTPEGTRKTEFTISIGSDSVARFVTELWSKVMPV